MDIAIPIFDGLTALDAVGPYEVLSRLPGARVVFVAKERGEVRADGGMLGLHADAALDELRSPGVVVVPGGPGTRELLDDAELLAWIRGAHETSRWTTSVCTGSLLLAAAGLLDGVDASTHWRAMELLASLGARPTRERVVERGKVLTAAGVTAGIDMALVLAARLAGGAAADQIRQSIEYGAASSPPADIGSADIPDSGHRKRDIPDSRHQTGRHP